MAYGFEARLLMFEAIRGSTCQRLLRAKLPQLAFLGDQCVVSSDFVPAPEGLLRYRVGKGIGDQFPNRELGIKWPHGEALLFASIRY